jgi:hypothetical protein
LKLLITLLLSLIAAYAVSCALTIFVNPEVTFWNEAVSQRLDAIASIREKEPGKPILFFTGGSSCAFSINPEIIEKITGRPAMNMGLPVAAGAHYIIHQALRQTRPGDTIVYTTAADILTYPDQEFSPAKISFALEARHGLPIESTGGCTFRNSLTIPQYCMLSRPGVDYLIVLVGRMASGKGYRYKLPDIRYRGLIQTPIQDPSLKPAGPRTLVTLSPGGRQLLETLVAAAQQKGVHVVYSIPLTYTATSDLAISRDKNRKFLAEVEKIMPVIEDGYSGAIDNIENFADGHRHLSDKGSRIRSEALAKTLQHHLAER